MSAAPRMAAAISGARPRPKYSRGRAMRIPLTPPSSWAVKSPQSRSKLVASRLSFPARAFSTRALSRTVRVSGPTWSREEAKATSPNRETLP